MTLPAPWRKSAQRLMPARPDDTPPPGVYDIYPGHSIGAGKIGLGWDALAERLVAARAGGAATATLDGFPGVLWSHLRAELGAALASRGVRASWVNVERALRPPAEIAALVTPFLGGDDPLFGRRFTGSLADFFDAAALQELRPDPAADLSLVYGCGAALARWPGPLIYCDVPKNEVQFRMRAGALRSLGETQDTAPGAVDVKAAYKRCYFVDWPAAGAHKAALLPLLDTIVDEQRPAEPAVLAGNELRAALTRLARSCFRVRPWFEPGPWGGQWIRAHAPQLPQDVPNYAWSFELITPENGLLLQSDGALCEVSFDFLMFQEYAAVLGESAERFRHDFPIRFNFLDTFDGGNLSVQCHPRPDYIRSRFGEPFTQDETYYILDCAPGAQVYVGFRDGVDPADFRAALERSFRGAVPVDVERFVNVEAAHKHDLFLIPNGTIHCSGKDNLVLEISATTYLFTFKMYDWMRLDLDGRPRPLNIGRAFENLYFERQGAAAHALRACPCVLAQGDGWQIVHLPTHPAHFYDVHRLEFTGALEVDTAGSVHVLSLVEGRTVLLETAGGERSRFNYAETFVVPAAAGHYRLLAEDGAPLKVVKAFIKPQQAWAAGSVV